MNLINRPFFVFDQWRCNSWFFSVLGLLIALMAGWVIGTKGVLGGLTVVAVPMAICLGIGILVQPKFGLFLYVNLSFVIGFARFLPRDTPMGTGLDAILLLSLLGTFLNGKQMDWKQLKQPVLWVLIVWLSYTILEYFNPEAPHRPAWFYNVRSFSLSWFFIAIIVMVNPISRKDIRVFITIWLVWSFLAALWAFKQQYIRLEPAELAWLAEGGARTHILWGQLRSFSFYSDAGQFGSEMAGVTLICLVLFFERTSWLHRIAYLILGVILFWGFAVSGTRGALFVILPGYPTYLFLSRNLMNIVRGIAVAAPILALLMFTSIGDSNYQIFRIRSALRPTEDASFLVRLENQEKLSHYLKKKPFGAGIGTSSGAGNRFSPNHFAAQIPTDSWYVQLWIETGVVGLTLYLMMLVGIILIGTYKIWHLNDPRLITLMIALLAEFVGIATVSYTNPILGQFPTSTIIFISSILFTTCNRWDTPKHLNYANRN
ncbi:O-antigen ligase family protein [Spirosoma pollinicola]|uniref:O-antigen polymerase n=1 Tax=Spirosoma pollinicola TaxID=2057025 RepID=A0A2K8Z1Y3_9BACT|nr:O-antigen ligase family protein [Spirosoma pollinicola]AUD03902.1 O-antigen polymerase [Spirosoma pollinicola]